MNISCEEKECWLYSEEHFINCKVYDYIETCEAKKPLKEKEAALSVSSSAGLGEPQFERNDTTDHVDEFSYHEVLDRASIIADMFDEQVLQHSVLKREPKLKEEAAVICELLHKFYQHWSSVRSEKFA